MSKPSVPALGLEQKIARFFYEQQTRNRLRTLLRGSHKFVRVYVQIFV